MLGSGRRTDRSALPDDARPTAWCELFGEGDVRLRATFWRQQDRYLHAVDLCSPEGDIRLLQSCEGDALESWPPSPPLQQLSQTKLPDGDTALLLIGMAGKNHWSLSVTIDRPRQALFFDVACRLSVHPGQLGSSYRLHVSPTELQERSIDLRAAGTVCSLQPESRFPDAATRLALTGDRVAIAPASVSSRFPATCRWQYRIGWGSAATPRLDHTDSPSS